MDYITMIESYEIDFATEGFSIKDIKKYAKLVFDKILTTIKNFFGAIFNRKDMINTGAANIIKKLLDETKYLEGDSDDDSSETILQKWENSENDIDREIIKHPDKKYYKYDSSLKAHYNTILKIFEDRKKRYERMLNDNNQDQNDMQAKINMNTKIANTIIRIYSKTLYKNREAETSVSITGAKTSAF